MPLIIHPPKRPEATGLSFDDPSEVLTGSAATRAGDRQQSPEPPPASPLTPVMYTAKPATFAQSASMPEPGAIPFARSTGASETRPVFIDQPPSLPFSGEDSTDAIALRAAISSLQFQRLQAQKDIRALENVKRQALKRPEDFRQHLLSGSLRAAPAQERSLQDILSSEHVEDDEEEEDGNTSDGLAGDGLQGYLNTGVVPDSQQSTQVLGNSFNTSAGTENATKTTRTQASQVAAFPPIPTAQEVVRCPPIEWAKYNIVGESLDKLHRDQQLHPGEAGVEGRESVIAAAYDPFRDRLASDNQEQASSGASGPRRDSGASAVDSLAQRRRSSKAFS